MLWEKIKKILQKEGGKCIIIEEGQPAYLVMKLGDYEEIEEVNRDINEWKAEEEESEAVETDNQEVKVEDLPF